MAKLDALTATWPQAGTLVPLVGDLTDPLLGLSSADRDRWRGQVDHVVHLAAVYDMTADEETDRRGENTGAPQGDAPPPAPPGGGVPPPVAGAGAPPAPPPARP